MLNLLSTLFEISLACLSSSSDCVLISNDWSVNLGPSDGLRVVSASVTNDLADCTLFLVSLMPSIILW